MNRTTSCLTPVGCDPSHHHKTSTNPPYLAAGFTRGLSPFTPFPISLYRKQITSLLMPPYRLFCHFLSFIPSTVLCLLSPGLSSSHRGCFIFLIDQYRQAHRVMLQSELDISRNFVNLYNFERKCYNNEPQEIFI
jgi:hypothetical protein